MECVDPAGGIIHYSDTEVNNFTQSKLISICGIVTQLLLLVLTLCHLYLRVLEVSRLWRTVLIHALLIANITFDLLQILQTLFSSLYFCQGGSPVTNSWRFVFLSPSAVCAVLVWTVRSWSRLAHPQPRHGHERPCLQRQLELTGPNALSWSWLILSLWGIAMTIHLSVLDFDPIRLDEIRKIVRGSTSFPICGIATATLSCTACLMSFHYVRDIQQWLDAKVFRRVRRALVSLSLATVIRSIALTVSITRQLVLENPSMKIWGSRSHWGYMMIVHIVSNSVMVLSLLWIHGIQEQADAGLFLISRAEEEPKRDDVFCLSK